MIYNFAITYMACQSCAAKVNCSTCNAKVEESLLRDEDISSATILIEKKTAAVETDLDQYDVEDMLEDMGIFV